MDEVDMRSLVEKAYDRACIFMSSAAAAGNFVLFNHMSLIIGSPRENIKPYQDALCSACDGGQVELVKALLTMSDDSGVKFDLSDAITAAKQNNHLGIVDMLKN